MSNMKVSCPLTTSVRAGAEPLYGTCCIGAPVSDFRSSPERWFDEPLPAEPKFSAPAAVTPPAGGVSVSGSVTLDRPLVLDGLMPRTVPPGQSMRITASFPNGAMQPLLWLHDYNERFQHPFLLRKPIQLPAGTVIRGVSPGAVVDLIPASGP